MVRGEAEEEHVSVCKDLAFLCGRACVTGACTVSSFSVTRFSVLIDAQPFITERLETRGVSCALLYFFRRLSSHQEMGCLVFGQYWSMTLLHPFIFSL